MWGMLILIFVHSYALARRNSTTIWGLQNQEGTLIEDDAHLKDMGAWHFTNLFTDDGASNIKDQLKVIRLFPSFLTEEDKTTFLSYFSLLEIDGVLKGLKKDKIPRPDG